MNEKADYSQLELFSPPQTAFAKESRGRYRFYFGHIKNYEKQILAIVVLLITGIISFSLGVEKGKRFARKGDLVPMQTKSGNTRIMPRTLIQPKTIEKNTAVTPTPPKDTFKYYTIQLASYRSKSSAQLEAKVLKNKGFLPVVLKKGEYTVLCAGHFPDREKALALLPELKKKYQDCFVRRL